MCSRLSWLATCQFLMFVLHYCV